ncbi:Alcohol dehydrogenase, class IV [Planctomicrobium piriforme]|uniref:Alcohol dehydrogenase, class IV n=2 Tax=Planctomicrobium piriforme TaxID=1576369 RepID=A0A1I3LBY1_9PLAN|nr:Alcohol dehydrogenase, class IV [Planctomicrobium piriforme]
MFPEHTFRKSGMTPFLHFDLLVPRRIVFGWGKRTELGRLAASIGRRAFIIDGSRTLRQTVFWTELTDSLADAKVTAEIVATAGHEPTIEDVDEATAIVSRLQPGPGDLVIGIGGGAALDLAKAVAAMATNADGASVREFLEGIGTGRSISVAPLPVLAIPTTAGTGSEATKNAVISCSNPPCKKSLRSERMVPDTVLIDPELTVPVSPQQTAWSGLDTVTQLIESYTSRRSQPATDVMCLFGLDFAISSLRTAYHSPTDREAREKMACAALYSGIALANSGLGMAHGVAAALGSICNVPHGLACAAMLPITLRTNLPVIRGKLDDLQIGSVSALSAANGQDPAEAFIAYIEQLCKELQIPARLRDLGVQREQLSEIAAGSRGNSMSGNPLELTDGELLEILETHW